MTGRPLVFWLFATLTTGCVAAPPTWVDIPIGLPESETAFDSSSLVVEGSQRTAWVLVSFSPRYQFDADEIPTSKLLGLTSFDCDHATIQSMREIHYDLKGKPYYTVEHPTQRRTAAPGTVDRAQLDAVCAARQESWFRKLFDSWLH
jgi:hypothetical protein